MGARSTALRRPLLITANSAERRHTLGMPRVCSDQSGNRGVCSKVSIFFRISGGSESKQRCFSRSVGCGSEGKNLFEIFASVFQIGAMIRIIVYKCRWFDEDAQLSPLEFACFQTRHSDQLPKSALFFLVCRQPNHPV